MVKALPLIAGLFLSASALVAQPCFAQLHQRPQFISESVPEFAAAYEMSHHRQLDSEHLDAHRYHAYRVATSGATTTVVARSVTVDSSGRLHIIGEPGTIASGRSAKGPGELHILLPITTKPQ